MPSIRLTSNGKRSRIRLLWIQEKSTNGLQEAMKDIGSAFTRQVRKEIKNSPKTFKKYRYRRRGRSFDTVSSKPGSYPANQTGNLINNIGFEVVGYRKMVVGVKSRVFYAPYLEFGTKKSSYRPFLFNTGKARQRDDLRIIQNRLSSELKK